MRRQRYIFLISVGVFCWLLASRAVAQEVDYTQYYLNLSGVNPGFTGMEDYVDLKLGYRQGLNGFGITNNDVFVSGYGALGATSQYSMKKNSLRISNLEAMEKLQSNQRVRRRQGIGGMVTNRTIGPYTSLNISGNYAYHLPISNTLNVSLGARVGYGSQRVDYNNYTVRTADEFFEQLKNNPGNLNTVSVDFGSVLYSNRFYFALSSTNLGLKSLNGDHSLSVANKRQISLQTAANLPLGTYMTLSTGAKLTHVDGYDLLWSVNGRLRFKDIVYLGAGYTGNSKISMLFGLSVNGKLNVNYCYDHYFTGLGNLNVNVHEVVIGVPLFNTFESKSRLW